MDPTSRAIQREVEGIKQDVAALRYGVEKARGKGTISGKDVTVYKQFCEWAARMGASISAVLAVMKDRSNTSYSAEYSKRIQDRAIKNLTANFDKIDKLFPSSGLVVNDQAIGADINSVLHHIEAALTIERDQVQDPAKSKINQVITRINKARTTRETSRRTRETFRLEQQFERHKQGGAKISAAKAKAAAAERAAAPASSSSTASSAPASSSAPAAQSPRRAAAAEPAKPATSASSSSSAATSAPTSSAAQYERQVKRRKDARTREQVMGSAAPAASASAPSRAAEAEVVPEKRRRGSFTRTPSSSTSATRRKSLGSEAPSVIKQRAAQQKKVEQLEEARKTRAVPGQIERSRGEALSNQLGLPGARRSGAPSSSTASAAPASSSSAAAAPATTPHTRPSAISIPAAPDADSGRSDVQSPAASKQPLGAWKKPVSIPPSESPAPSSQPQHKNKPLQGSWAKHPPRIGSTSTSSSSSSASSSSASKPQELSRKQQRGGVKPWDDGLSIAPSSSSSAAPASSPRTRSNSEVGSSETPRPTEANKGLSRKHRQSGVTIWTEEPTSQASKQAEWVRREVTVEPKKRTRDLRTKFQRDLQALVKLAYKDPTFEKALGRQGILNRDFGLASEANKSVREILDQKKTLPTRELVDRFVLIEAAIRKAYGPKNPPPLVDKTLNEMLKRLVILKNNDSEAAS